MQQRLVVSPSIPPGLPGAIDTQPKANRMYLLTHALLLPILDDNGNVRVPPELWMSASLGDTPGPLEGPTFICHDRVDIEIGRPSSAMIEWI
jgi:hypothetical protein